MVTLEDVKNNHERNCPRIQLYKDHSLFHVQQAASHTPESPQIPALLRPESPPKT